MGRLHRQKHSILGLRRLPLVALCLGLMASCAKKSPESRDSGISGSSPESNDPATQTGSNKSGGSSSGPVGASNSGTTTAKGEPISVPDALATPKTHFQTRSDLTLPIAATDLEAGDRIELKQKNTDVVILSSEVPSGFGAAENFERPKYFVEQTEYSLVTADKPGQALGYRTMMRLVPRLLIADRKLQYGSNSLRLLLSTTSEDREAIKNIVLRDFSYFALGTATFLDSTPKQRANTYQGRVSWTVGGVVRASNVDLTVGTIGILNR